MSDLGRLFRLRGAPGQEPLENFTTVALAIAISHDDRPMKHALRAVDWTYQQEDDRCPPKFTINGPAANIVSIASKTQIPLRANGNDCRTGYLDLVLDLVDAQQHKSVIWVEVKVDAWESGDQICNYKRHAALLLPSPAIITLGRMRVTPYVPALKWSDVVDAIALEPNPHHAWLSLREFLLDEKIVRPPVSTEPLDADKIVDVIVDVNQRVRRLWPNSGTALAWRDGDLRSGLKRWVREGLDLMTSGGPLRYGPMPASNGWEWGLVVTTKNDAKVPLDAQQILRAAEVGALPPNWVRHADRFEVLERRLSGGGLKPHDEIVTWFDTGLRQLRDSKILDQYLEGFTKKRDRATAAGRDLTEGAGEDR